MRLKILKKEKIIGDDKPFDSCHASTLIQTIDGTVIVAWFAGSREGNPDVSIWFSRLIDGKWEIPRIAADIHGIATWNPVLFEKNDGAIILFFKVGATISKWKTLYVESHDNGSTFSNPRELVPGDNTGGRGPAKNKPIRLKNGTILAPASVEGDTWDSFVDISKDNCRTWQRSSWVPVHRAGAHMHMPYNKTSLFGKGVIQPTLWQDNVGDVHMLLRTTSSRIFRSDSTDGGFTWCTAYDTGIPNNNSGIDLVQYHNGDLILAYNPRENQPGMFKGPRTPLSIAISKNNGQTFTKLMDLEDEPGAYCYPAIISNLKGEILLTYTWKRENIAFCKLAYEIF